MADTKEKTSVTGMSFGDFQSKYVVQKPKEDPNKTVDITGLGFSSGGTRQMSPLLVDKGFQYDAVESSPDNATQQFLANESGWSILGDMLAGGAKQFAGSFLYNAAANDPTSTINLLTGEGKQTNALQDVGLNMIKSAQKENQILQDPRAPSRIFNWRYAAQQGQSMGITLGMMAEGFAEQAIIELATSGFGSASTAFTVGKTLKNIASINKWKTFAFGGLQGVKEANMNAAFTADEVREKYKALGGYTEEEIEKIASKTATDAFRVEVAPLILMNALQWGALGHYNPLSKAMPGFMTSSGAVEGLGSALIKKAPWLGKTGAKAAALGIQVGSEAFEETYQNAISQGSQYKTDVKYGNTNNKTLSDYIFNQGTLDEAIGGALGGLMFGTAGKVMNRANLNKEQKEFGKWYDDQVMKGGVEMVKEDMDNLKNVMETGTPEQFEKARRVANKKQAMLALRLDSMKGNGETAMFDSRIEQMKKVMEAVQKNDTEFLTQFDIEQEDKEYILKNYPAYIAESEQFKNDLLKNIGKSIDYDSAETLTELNMVRNTNLEEIPKVEADIAQVTMSPGFQSLGTSLGTYAKIRFELESMGPKYRNSAIGKERTKVLNDQMETLRNDDFDPDHITEAQDTALKSFGEVETAKNQFFALNQLREQVQINNEDVLQFSTPNVQLERKKENFQKRVTNVANYNEKGLSNVEREAKELGLLTPELQNTINTRRQDLKAKAKVDATVNKVKKKDTKKVPIKEEVIQARTDKAVEVAATIPTNPEQELTQEEVDAFMSASNEIVHDEGDDLFDIREGFGNAQVFRPALPNNNDWQKNFDRLIKVRMEAGVKNFKELIALISRKDAAVAEKSFNYIVQAWKNNGGVVEDASKIYDEFFGDVALDELMQQVYDANTTKELVKEGIEAKQVTVTAEEAKRSIDEAEKRVADEDSKDYEDSNKPGNSVIEHPQIAEATPKLPFLGLQYRVVYDKEGGYYKFETTGEDINREGDSNLNIVLNHRIFKEGTEFKVRINPNWRTQKVQFWHFESGTQELKSTPITMEQWMKEKGFTAEEIADETLFADNKEKYDLWLSKVPIDMVFNGERIGSGAHDIDWWNERNTASFVEHLEPAEAELEQQKLIKQGREEVMRIRRGIDAGNDTMVITARREGFATFVPDTQPRLRLGETNPSAILCFKDRNGVLYVKLPEKSGMTQMDPTSIINAKSFETMGAGFPYMLTEARTDTEGKPMYVLNAIVTNDEQFQEGSKGNGEFAKWSKSLIVVEKYAKLLITNDKSNPKEFEKAQKLKAEIQALTGINIAQASSGTKISGMSELRGMFPSTTINPAANTVDVNATGKDKTAKVVFKTPEGHNSYTMKLQKNMFAKNGMPHITVESDGSITVKNYTSPWSGMEGYEAFLKDYMTTQRKFFKIQDENQKDMYVAYVQPIINYDFANAEELKAQETSEVPESKPVEVKAKVEGQTEETEEAPTEVKAEVVPVEKPEITEITPGQKQRVINYLLHKILNSLGSKDVTYPQVVKELNRSFLEYLGHLDKPETKAEHNYLVKHKNEILGLSEYARAFNTVREKLEAWIGEKIKDEDIEKGDDLQSDGVISDEGMIEKGLNDASYSYNFKNSISARLKRLFAAIPREKNKTGIGELGGLEEFYEPDLVFDVMQNMLCDIPNSMEDLEKKIASKFQSNPKEFEFLGEVLKRLKATDAQLQKEFLFHLNQTKNSMYMILVKGKDGYELQTLNADSREPVYRIQNGFKENFKLSNLIDRVEAGYKVNIPQANLVTARFEEWVKVHNSSNFANISIPEVKEWLENFGIFVSEKSIQDLKAIQKTSDLNGGRTWETLFKKGGLFSNLNKNLIEMKGKENVLSFSREKENVLTLFNNGYLKDLAIIEANNFPVSGSVMRIAGVNVMPFSQPNFASEQMRKLKEADSPLLANLAKASFSSNNFLVKLLTDKSDDIKLVRSKKVRRLLNMNYVSLQAIKKEKDKNSDNAGITEISPSDYTVVQLGFMQEGSNSLGKEDMTGVDIKPTKMTSPPLSDSSQMFVMDTVKLDLTQANFSLNDDGTANIDGNVLDFLFTQLVLPDLQRIMAYTKAVNEGQDVNIQFHEIGSQIFTILPELNTLDIDGVELLRLVKLGIEANKDMEGEQGIVTPEIKAAINKAIENVILDNVYSKFNTQGGIIRGSWVDEQIISVEKGKISDIIMDKEYLTERCAKGASPSDKLRVAALDFAINNYIHQAQFQMLFAGDFANYTSESDGFFEKLDAMTLEDRKEAYIEYMKKSSTNFYKRMKEQLSPGNRLADSKNKTYHQLIVNDKETVSSVLESIIKLWYPAEYNDKAKTDVARIVEVESLMNKYKTEPDTLDREIKLRPLEAEYKTLLGSLKKSFPNVADYLQINYTDGQEFTTWKEHLDVLFFQGRLSQEVYDSAKAKLESQSKGVTEENKLSAEEKSVIFQPIKPLHAGMYFPQYGDYTAQHFVYVKTSSFPLIPEMTLGLELDKVRKNIEQFETENGEHDRVRVTYKSGIKVGATKNNIDIEELYNEDYASIKDKIASSSLVLNRDNFSIQQDKPFKTDKHVDKNEEDSINRGTQIDKILFGNGINKITEKVFQNMFDAEFLEEFGIENTEMLSGEDLYNIYNELGIKEQQIQRRGLFEELGIDENSDWFNQVDTLKKIQKLLSERLSNYQDEGIVKLKYKVVKDGITYFVDRDELQASGLKATGAEFNVPIWLSPNSQKFESVLNSIVNNRTVKMKIAGGSSPVASQEGYIKKRGYDTLNAEEKGGIIFTSSFDAEKGLTATHYEDGSIKYAQILLASKLRKTVKDDKGFEHDELIDPAQYTKVVDGKTVLDFDKIDPEVLQMFSFRIPTSAHQSGTLIEVVGFLPHAMGDQMIVPKDHVTQIGEDFDIDVRYYYKQNTFQDADGKIRRLRQSDVPTTTSDAERRTLYIQYKDMKERVMQESTNTKNEFWRNNQEILYNLLFAVVELRELKKSKVQGVSNQEAELRDEITFLKSVLLSEAELENRKIEEAENLDTLLKQMEEERLDKDKELISQYMSAKAVDKMKTKVLENNIVGLYKSIYSSTDEGVQRRINATLSTEFAKKTANLIQEKIGGQVKSEHFSILDDRVQRDALKLGASGRLGIGVHSNWVVFNSLLEQLPEEKRLQVIKGITEDGDAIPFMLKIGKYISDGTLGKEKTFDLERSIATVNMENQNCSTDNQKIQIMGKRNENKFTINEFALMCNLGFDQGNSKYGKVHIPSLFISQPILRRYVELREQHASIFTEYSSDTEREIAEQLKKEFGEGVTFQVDKQTEEETMYMDREAFYEAASSMSADEFINNLEKADNSIQWAVYQQFQELQAASKNLNKVMQLMNIEKDGLGMSFFNTIEKKDTLINTMFGRGDVLNEDLNLKNVREIFGEHVVRYDVSDVEERELIDDGYIFVATEDNKSHYVKPTTAQNAKLVNSISIGYNLWKSIFPFEDKVIAEQIETILWYTGIDGSTKKGLEMKYKILSSMKDFLYAYPNPSLFGNSVAKERERLTLDKDGNRSLATRLNDMKNNGSILFQLPFFKDLEFDIFPEGNEPSIVKYNVNAGSGINKNEAYIQLESLLGSETVIEEGYTENDLLKDLVAYSMLAGQEKGAIGFRNYLPITALEKFDVTRRLKGIASVQSNRFNIALNGTARTITRLMGSYYSGDNVIRDGKLKRSPSEERYIEDLIQKINSTYGDGTMIWDKEQKVISVNNLDNSNFESNFVEQYFQHNPEDAPRLSWSGKNTIIESKDDDTWDKCTKITLKADESVKTGPYMVVKKPKSSQLALYKQTSGSLDYVRIVLLGGFGMNEFSTSGKVNKSLYEDNNVPEATGKVVVEKKTITPNVTSTVLESGSTSVKILADIANNSTNEGYKRLAKELMQYANPEIKVVSQEDMAAQGAEGMYKDGVISIDANIAKDTNSNTFQAVFIEEKLHGLTSSTIKSYVTGIRVILEGGKVTVQAKLQPGISQPYYMTKLIDLYRQGVQAVIDSYAKTGMTQQEIYDKIVAIYTTYSGTLEEIKKNKPVNATPEDQMLMYRTLNIDEFVAGIFTDPAFRVLMDKTEYKSTGRTILEHFKEIVKRILGTIGGDRVENSITEHVVEATFALLKEQKAAPKTKEVVKVNHTAVSQADEEALFLIDDASLTDLLSREAPQEESKTINIYAGTNENTNLSNFANRPFRVNYGASYTDFTSVEQAFQAAKREYSEDTPFNSGVEEKIIDSKSAATAKSLGRTFKGFDSKRWDKDSSKIMKNLILESFKQNPEALAKLLATGNATLTHTQDKGKWGTEFPRILMEVRKELGNMESFTDDVGESTGSFKPALEALFNEGRVETQGFYLTLAEYNSMSKEEQENFKNCL